jgi:hypothetical protein
VPDHLRPAYISVVALGFVIFTIMPFAIFSIRRPEWRHGAGESEMQQGAAGTTTTSAPEDTTPQ